MRISQVIIVKEVREVKIQNNSTEYDYSDLDHLLQIIASGDMDALSHLYKLTSAAVYSYALSILKNPQDAEDILHDCFVRIFTYTRSYRSQGKPMAWILTITRHLCMSKLQLRKREPQIYLQDWKEYIDDRSCINQDDKILISYCMESLPDEERQIIILHCVSGMSFREIAQFLKLPISTVLSKYHRTIKKLRNRIGEEV